MNNIILLLLIQGGLLLLVSLLGYLFALIKSRNDKRKKLFSIFTSLIFLGFAIAIFSIFLVNFFGSPIIQIKESVPIVVFHPYSFEIGFQLTLAQSIIYFTVMFILALTNVFLTWKKPYWKEKYTSKISLYSITLILVILSTNFFQILLFMLIADLLIIDLVISLTLISKEKVTIAQKSMIGSFIIGNALLISSSVLLAYEAKSLDFNIVSNDILTNPTKYEPVVQLFVSLLLLGIIAKNALFPFHTWFKKTCSPNGDSIFLFLSTHFTIILSFIYITPFVLLISLQGSTFFVWYGLLFALISVIFSLFLQQKLETVILVFALLSGLFIFFLGLGYLSISFQLLIALPIISIGLVPFLFTPNEAKEDEKPSRKSVMIIRTTTRFIGFVIIFLSILGVEPFNGTFLSLIHILSVSSPAFNIGFFVITLLLFFGIFCLSIILYKKQITLEEKFQFTNVEITITILVVIFLSLNSFLYPRFNIINPFTFPSIITFSHLLISLISLLSGCLIVLCAFIIIKKYFESFSKKLLKFTVILEKIFRNIYTFDFIFAPVILVWTKAIVPASNWFYQIVIKKIMVENILMRIWKFIVTAYKFIARKTKDTVIPNVVKFFKLTSNFIQKLEESKLRSQIQVVLVSLFLLIIVVLILYSGGKI